jgi:DNA-binding XRE family transcriptional regulator
MARKATEKAPQLDSPDERLKWARKRAGLEDATAAARRFGWNTNTYRSHENGTRDLSRKAAVKYANAFKIHAGPGWLLYGEGALTPLIDPEIPLLWANLDDQQRKTLKDLLRQMVRRAA